MRNRIDHWCTVDPGNPNPRVHRSSGKLSALFPTGTVDPRVGISLSPLNTNDRFSLPGVQEKGGKYPEECFKNCGLDQGIFVFAKKSKNENFLTGNKLTWIFFSY